MLVLSVAAYRPLPLPVRLRTQSMDTVKFPGGRFPVVSRPLASPMVVNIFPTLVCFLCLQCSLAVTHVRSTGVEPSSIFRSL